MPPEHTDNATQSPSQPATRTGITVTNDYDNFLTVMQRQNGIADLLVLQHKQTSLPAREILVFDIQDAAVVQ